LLRIGQDLRRRGKRLSSAPGRADPDDQSIGAHAVSKRGVESHVTLAWCKAHKAVTGSGMWSRCARQPSRGQLSRHRPSLWRFLSSPFCRLPGLLSSSALWHISDFAGLRPGLGALECVRRLGLKRPSSGSASKDRPLFAGRPLPILQDPRLRECDYGDFEGRPRAEMKRAQLAAERDGQHIMLVGHGATLWMLAHWLQEQPLETVVGVLPERPWYFALDPQHWHNATFPAVP